MRASANAIRNVSEWDDSDLPFPYPDRAKLGKKSTWRQPMAGIEVIQRAFGLGMHVILRDVGSMHTIVAVDRLSTGLAEYARFEAAMVAAAREIAEEADRRDPSLNANGRLDVAI